MSIDDFYTRLPIFDSFADVARFEDYAPLPDDWHVVVTDVEGSTAAVKQGRYKDVNLLGASSIMAVLNAVKPLSIPFVFGGDGASLAIPASLLDKTRAALQSTQHMARTQFNLKLRAGIVPVRVIRAAGAEVCVARCRVSHNYVQAAFSGGGLQLAESLIKDQHRGAAHRIEESLDNPPRADYSGLECRWNNIPSPRGEIVTLLVHAGAAPPAQQARVYREVIAEIERIYGVDAGPPNPIDERELRLSAQAAVLDGEARVQCGRRGAAARIAYRCRAQMQSLIGRWLMARGWRAGGIDWGRYKRDVVANTDFRKFDDVLRHVLSGDGPQRARLVAALEARHQRGELTYGLHVAPAALMTCLIFAREGSHVHFVDGADGGYTAAADDFKRRLSCALPNPESAPLPGRTSSPPPALHRC